MLSVCDYDHMTPDGLAKIIYLTTRRVAHAWNDVFDLDVDITFATELDKFWARWSGRSDHDEICRVLTGPVRAYLSSMLAACRRAHLTSNTLAELIYTTIRRTAVLAV
jgi:hypothetical protein